MKKIIAFMLCSTSSCFGLNMSAPLKPNACTLSQSWSNLSFTKQAMIIAASVVSLVGIFYTAWPDSEKSAWRKANSEFLSMIKNGKSPEEIEKMFNEKINPAVFAFGPFWNRNAFHVKVDIYHPEDLHARRKTTILAVTLTNAKTKQTKRYQYGYESSLATLKLNPWSSCYFTNI